MPSAIFLGLIGASPPIFIVLSCIALSDDLSRIKKTYSRINPSLSHLPAQKQNEARQRAATFPRSSVTKHRAPRTTFQGWCREKHMEDLQHFTRTLKAATVERYAYTTLPAHEKYSFTDAD